MPDGRNTTSFERLVLPHLDAAYNVARWLLRDEADAHDVVQESTMRALRYFQTFRGEDPLPWLLRIVRNAAYTLLEKRRRDESVETLSDDNPLPDPASIDPAAELSRQVDIAALRAAVEALPPEFREVIVLRELEGLSYKEIAAATSVSIGTVMSRLARARKRLQSLIPHEAASEADHGM